MEESAGYAFIVGFAWAAIALLVQLLRARGTRVELGERAGSPLAGIAYNFTGAMLPSHKESATLHLSKFFVGVTMHIGAFTAFACLLLSRFGVNLTGRARYPLVVIVGLGLAAGIFLCFRRVFSITLRRISSPDDFVAILATCGLMATTAVFLLYPPALTAAYIYAAVLLVYLPFGKLRHVVFFFAARAEFGARLGARGVYPPPK
ncbi:MAG: hypothetical protein RDV41_01735 [Planctomycetota bacterium]|nr:hypothetical protein [Planctomycetota bacterium]